MAELRIQGIPDPVQVDPSFGDLSPEQQAATVEQIRTAWQQRQAGATSQQPTGVGLAALQQGANTAGRAVSSTFGVLGDAAGDTAVGRGLHGVRDFADQITPNAPEGYVPSGPAVAQSFRDGDYGATLRNLPGAVAEALPGMAATIGAGAAGSAVGGPAAGLAAAGLTSAAQTFGPVAMERAANNNTVPHDPANMAAAGLTTAGVAAVDAVSGMGGRLTRAAPATGFLPRVGRAVVTAGVEGGGEAIQEVVQQTGQTLGTARGWSVDPAEVAAAGVTGAAARGATAMPGAAVRGTAETVARRAADAVVGDISPDQAESQVRVADMYERRAADVRARTGLEANPEDVLNGMRLEIANQMLTLVTQAQDAGWLNQDQFGEGRTMRGLVHQAASHNHSLPTGEPGIDFSLGEGLGQIDRLTRAPSVFRDNMRALLTDLDVLSRAGRKNQMTGPFETVGRALGGAAGVVAGAATGAGGGPVMSGLTAVAGNPIGKRIGGMLGAGVDRFLGVHQPVVLLARDKARRLVEKNGGNPGDTRALLTELDRVLTDERLAERAAAGLPTDADTMARLAAEAASKRLERESKQAGHALARDIEAMPQAESTDYWALQARSEADAEARNKQTDKAWTQHLRATRPDPATPEDVQRLLDAARRRDAITKANDTRRAPVAAEDQRPGAEADEDPRRVAAATASQERAWIEALQARARAVAELARRVRQGETELARGEAADADAPARAGETDAQRRAREIEAAYKARDAQARTDDRAAADQAARAAAEADARAAEVANSAAPVDPNLDAVTRDQIREWEATLAESRARAEQAGREAAKANAPEQPVVQAARKRAKAKPKPKPAPAPAEAPPAPAPPVAPEAPPAAPAPAPLPEAHPTPETPPVPAQAPASEPSGQGHTYVRSVLFSKGVQGRVRASDIDAAVERLGERGDMLPDEVELYQGNNGFWPPSVAKRVAAEIAREQGVDLEGLPDVADRFGRPFAPGGGGAGPGPGFYRPDVRDPASWQGAADATQDHLRFYRERAVAADDFGLAETVARFSSQGRSELSQDQRKAIAQAVVKAGTPEQRGLRRAAMAPWLNGEDFADAPPPPATTATPAAEAPAAPRRGRPPGTGKNQRAAAAAAAAEAQASLGGDGTVELNGERVDATDGVLQRTEQAFARLAPGLRAKLVGDDTDAADRAEAQLQRNEAKLREIRAANAAWRARTIEGKPSE